MERSWGRRVFGGDQRIARARDVIARRGPRAVLVGRFIVGFRAPVFMMSGAMGLTLRQFVLWDSIGLCIAIPLALFLGFWFGQPVVDGLQWVLDHARIPLFIGLAFAAVWWFRSSGASDASPSDDSD